MYSLRRIRIGRMLSAILVLGLTVSGCALRENGHTDERRAGKRAQYAMVLRALSDPAEAAVKQGIETRAQNLGVTVDIFAARTADDTDGQLELLEQCIAAGYQAIGISPLTADNLIEGISKARKKGIYIVNLEKETDREALARADGQIAAFVSADPMQDGANAAYYMLSMLTAGGDIAVLSNGEDTVCEARRKSAEENFRMASGVRLVETCEGGGDAKLAFAQTADLLRRYPHLKGIYACNDAMALGAVRAAEEAGKLGELLIVGTDGTPDALESVQAGKLSATVAVDWAQIGAAALEKMIEAVRTDMPLDTKAEPETIKVVSYIAEKER